uniref:Uncharacterized protein n=1 Tax=Cacopsylla melanoneura TaxID=428564 RepID=A0A8D9B4P4_9HEMI
MPARKGLLAPQNTFLDTIATRFDGNRLRHRILAPPGEQLHADRRLHADPLAARELPTTNNAPVLGSKQNTRWALLRLRSSQGKPKYGPQVLEHNSFWAPIWLRTAARTEGSGTDNSESPTTQIICNI